MSAAEPRDGTRDASSTARIPTQDAPGLGRNTGGVRLHRVPNPRWRAVPCASLRAHPRYVALPPVERVLCGASTTPVVDDAALPFVRQHTDQWIRARAGRVTTSTFALALGFWSDDFAVSHLRLPPRGRASRNAVLAAARDAVSFVAHESAREVLPHANAVTRTRCLEAVEAYNAELAAANGDDLKLAALDAGGWAVTRERAVVAAAGGARDVACALGKEQEAAALLAVLGAFPNSYLVETGAVALSGDGLGGAAGANLNLAASPDGVLVFPALGHSEDATETTLARAVEAGFRSECFAKPTRSKSKPFFKSTSKRGAPPRLAVRGVAASYFGNVFPDDETRVAVAVEVKVASPFVWSTSGLKSYNNQAQYKVDAASDGAKDHVAPIHVPQAQLEAAALRVAGTVVVSYSPVSGGANAGASLRMRYVPRDDAYVKCALEVLRANAIAEDIVGSSLTHVGSSGEETRSRFLRLVRKTKRLASSAALVADLAPIPIPDGADDVPFLR